MKIMSRFLGPVCSRRWAILLLSGVGSPSFGGHIMAASALFGFIIMVKHLPSSIVCTLIIAKRPSQPKGKFLGLTLSPTNALIFINVMVFLACKALPGLSSKLVKYDRLVARGEKYRLITACFAHGSISHIAMNSYSLYNIGPLVDRTFGTARFLVTYLASGVIANIGTYLFNTSPLSLGASSCIFGLMGALATHSYRNKEVLGPSADAVLDSIKRTVFMNLMYSAMLPGIDNAGHFGGLVGGAVFAFLFGPRIIRLRTNYGNRLVDQPLFNYIPYWKRFLRLYEVADVAPEERSGNKGRSGGARPWERPSSRR